MLRRATLLRVNALTALSKLGKPPQYGYELSEIPHESSLPDYLAAHKSNLVHVIVGNGGDDELTKKLTSVLHHTPLGDPECVKIALIQRDEAPKWCKEHNVMAYPTTLLWYDGKVTDRVVGVRPKELMTKSRFLLRREGMNVYSAP